MIFCKCVPINFTVERQKLMGDGKLESPKDDHGKYVSLSDYDDIRIVHPNKVAGDDV